MNKIWRQWVFDIMKDRAFIIVLVVLVSFFSRISWGIGSPIGPGTVPPSSLSSGLVPSPNPIDSSGNLIVTDGIVVDRHFRGFVPYNAISDFEEETALSSIDSFLRRSADSGNIGSYIGRYQPYYSPTGTVATMQPGRRGVFRGVSTTIDGGVPGPDTTGILPALPEEESLSEQYAREQNIAFRAMAMTPEELKKIISNELDAYSKATKAADEQHQAQIEQYRRDFKQLSEEVDRLKSVLRDPSKREPKTGDDFSQKLFSEPMYEDIEYFLRLESMEGPQLQISEDGQLDVYEQMRQWINTLKISPEYQKSQDVDTQTIEQAEEEKRAEEKGIQQREFSSLDELSDEEISMRARAIWGEYKSFASFSEGKFNKFMRAAEAYLKQGKYYRAADAYTLALIYKPADALAYAGKSHALFAAGEYMSSALFLSRALDIFPEYARFKIDLVAMVGDRDKLEARCADVEQWVKLSDAGELQFLLGYVYYQMGRLSRASEAIGAAYKKMPDSPAVNTLKKAIDPVRSKTTTSNRVDDAVD